MTIAAMETETKKDKKARDEAEDWSWLALSPTAFEGAWDRKVPGVGGTMSIEVGASITIACDESFPPESVFRNKVFTAKWIPESGFLKFFYEDYPGTGKDVEYHVETRGSDGKRRWVHVHASGRPETFDAEDGGGR